MTISAISAGSQENLTAQTTATTGGVTTTTGSTFVVFVASTGTFNTNPISDNKGNTAASWQLIQSQVSALGVNARLYFFPNAAGGAGHTFTVTTGSGGDTTSIWAVEVKNAAVSSFDQSAAGNDDLASPFTSGTTGSTAQASEAVVVGYFDNRGSAVAPTWGNGFATIDDSSNVSGVTGGTASKIVAATGTQQSSFTNSAVSEAVTFIATFKDITVSNSLGQDLKVVGPGVSPDKTRQFFNRPLASGPPSAIGVLAGTATLVFGASAQVQAGQGKGYTPGPGLSPDYRFVFRPVQLGFSSGVTIGVLAGTASLTFSQTGTLVGTGALTGSVPLTFAVTGALDASAGALAGNTSLVFGQTGTLVGSGAITGTAAITFGSSSTLSGTGAMTGTSALIFAQTGNLGSGGQLIGTSPLTFGQTGALTGAGAMSGTASLTFGGTSTLQASGALIGTAQLLFQLTGFNAGVGAGSPGTRNQLGLQFYPNH